MCNVGEAGSDESFSVGGKSAAERSKMKTTNYFLLLFQKSHRKTQTGDLAFWIIPMVIYMKKIDNLVYNNKLFFPSHLLNCRLKNKYNFKYFGKHLAI